MSRLEPHDRFDQEWPHALRRELSRVPLPVRRPRGRYLRSRPRRGPAGGPLVRPALAAVLVAVVAGAATVLATSGRLSFSGQHGPPQSAHVRQQTNEGVPAVATKPAIRPSLAPIVTAPVGAYSYNWYGTQASPQAWTPGALNDWDLLATSDFPSDLGGSMQAGYGQDCAPPPATHPIRALADSAYLCRNQLMTAINGGGDAPKTYGGVYFAPAQLADFGAGTVSITWQVSTRRSSPNDWWDVWLTPFDENLVAPAGPSEVPAFNGPPADAVHIRVDNGTCPGSGQPATLGTVNGVPIGTVFDVEAYANHKESRLDRAQPCLESAVGRVGPASMASFRLDVSQGHVRFSVARPSGASLVFADAPVRLPFQQAVLQFAHHSLDPSQGCGQGSGCGPNTYHWSNVSVDPALPFTMLRPNGGASIHGQGATLELPQPAPAGAYLRFYAFGSIRVGFDGHPAQAAVPQPGQRSGTGEASYWTAVPEGTKTVTVSGSGSDGLPWWVFDTSVWAPAG